MTRRPKRTTVKRERDARLVFDWYFSDISKKHGARHHAVVEKPKETDRLMALTEVDSLIHFALWSQLSEGHPVRELWLETNTDLQATIYLAYGGFFRQALTVLRSWFEIAVHGVFFADHHGQPTGRYEQWRRGGRNAPANMLNISASLAARISGISGSADAQAISRRLEPVYSSLSSHAHGQGLDIYDLQEGRDNVPRYLPKSFDVWAKSVFEAADAVYFLYRLFYIREIGGYLEGSKQEMRRAKALRSRLATHVPEFIAIIDAVAGT